jgi:hypothetical protein
MFERIGVPELIVVAVIGLVIVAPVLLLAYVVFRLLRDRGVTRETRRDTTADRDMR